MPAINPMAKPARLFAGNKKPGSAGTREEFVAQIMALPVRERDFMSDQLDAFEYVGCLGSQRELA